MYLPAYLYSKLSVLQVTVISMSVSSKTINRSNMKRGVLGSMMMPLYGLYHIMSGAFLQFVDPSFETEQW